MTAVVNLLCFVFLLPKQGFPLSGRSQKFKLGWENYGGNGLNVGIHKIKLLPEL